MNSNLLRMIHITVRIRANAFNYPNNIPNSLASLEKENPSKNELYDDYAIISSHFKHPVFKDFVPTYYELVDCPMEAWEKRLNVSY